jgi:hypothetical protein
LLAFFLLTCSDSSLFIWSFFIFNFWVLFLQLLLGCLSL